MKRYLLGTTALVAAGMLMTSNDALAQAKEQPIQMSLGGYMAQFVSYTSQDDRAPSTPGVATFATPNSGKAGKFQENPEAEIWFVGRSTLANGLTISLRVELEGNTSGDQIDETWMALEGMFGRFELGSLNDVQYRMAYSAPDLWPRGGAFLNEGYIIGNVAFGTTGSSTGDSTLGASHGRFFDNDSQKINYYTPRWGGLQVGATYTPNLAQDQFAPYGQHLGYTNEFVISANFVRTFGDFDVAASAGWKRMNGPDIGVGGVSQSQPDPKQYTIGLQVGYAGFRIGGAWGKIKDGRTGASGTFATANATGTGLQFVKGRAYDLGAQYTWGPWGVSLTYFNGRNDDSFVTQVDAGNDKFTALSLTGIYKIGPGMTFNVTGFTSKQVGNGVGGTAVAGNASSDDNKANGVITGLTLLF